MSEYDISVIIPTFNSENTIERLIHSLLSQDFNNFEMIFVDDASTDETVSTILETLKDEQASYKIIVNKENEGPGYSRNRGIYAAKGKYIVFIDSDDIVQFNHLSSLYKHVQNDGIDSVFTKGVKIDDEGELFDFKVDKFDPLIKIAKENKGILRASELIDLELNMKIPFYFVLLIYDKKIISENELWFDEDFRYGEDTTFALRYLANCSYIRIIDKYTYFYYQETDSITKTTSLKRFESVKLFEELYDYFQEHGLNNSAELLIHSRIPRFIFGNMNYFFYNDYDKEEIFKKMKELDLFNKLRLFKINDKHDKKELKFYLKVKLFSINPDSYYKLWKMLKNKI